MILLIAEPPIHVLPELANAVGFNEAAMVQEIHYWLHPDVNSHVREGRHWIPNLSQKLQERFFFWDQDTIDYMVAQLEQSGILMVFQDSPSKIQYHTINYDFLNDGDGTSSKFSDTPFVQNSPIPKMENANTQKGFTAEVHVKGPNLYAMEIQDLRHFLACELILEIQEGSEKSRSREVICHFPNILDDQLKEFVWGDETLYGIILVLFQMSIMKELLSFCATHHASKLIIFADDAQAEELGIYHDFLAYMDETITPNGEKTEMIISANRQTFEAWIEFMKETTIKFRQTLWHDQKHNPAIRNYLKSREL